VVERFESRWRTLCQDTAETEAAALSSRKSRLQTSPAGVNHTIQVQRRGRTLHAQRPESRSQTRRQQHSHRSQTSRKHPVKTFRISLKTPAKTPAQTSHPPTFYSSKHKLCLNTQPEKICRLAHLGASQTFPPRFQHTRTCPLL